MGSSIATKAQRRADDVYEPNIRGALEEGNAKEAFTEAVRHLRSELVGLLDRRPGDGAVTAAQLAAQITTLAAQLHNHKPVRPPGCPKVPQPDDLLYVYDSALADARGEERSDD